MFKIDEDLARARKYFSEGDDRQALAEYQKIQQENKLTPDQSSEILYHSAVIKKRQGYYEEAKALFIKLFQEALVRSHRYDETKALHQLALLAYESKDYPEALRLFRKELGLWYSEMRRYFSGLSANFLAQGNCFMAMGDYQEAAMYFRHAYTFAATENDDLALGRACYAQASLHLKNKRPKEALKSFKLALSAYKLAGEPTGIAQTTAAIEELEHEKRQMLPARKIKKTEKKNPA